MTDLKQAMLQAVDALGSNNPDIQLRAAVTLRAALAAPQPEPVGVLWQHEETGRTDFLPLDEGRVTESRWGRVGPLYLHPPQRQPLTVDELRRQHSEIEALKAERDAVVAALKWTLENCTYSWRGELHGNPCDCCATVIEIPAEHKAAIDAARSGQ